MTTTVAPEAETKVDLTANANANGSAPKRRGRPPGSKNKNPKKTTANATVTPRRTTPAAPKTTDITAHAVLIENGRINVLLADGTSFKIDAPVFDRR